MDLCTFAVYFVVFVLFLVLIRRKSAVTEDDGLFYKLKWWISLLFLKLIWKKDDKNDNVHHEMIDCGLGLVPSRTDEKNETTQQTLNTLESPQMFDAVSFTGTDSKGNCILVKVKKYDGASEVWVLIRIAEFGIFKLPIHPDSLVYNSKDNSFSSGGLTCEVLEPMRRWRVSFNGLLRKYVNDELEEKEEDEITYIRFSFIWTAITIPFSNNTELSKDILARDMAKNKWNKYIFADLNHVLRQENEGNYNTMQWGQLYGTVNVGQDELILHLRGLRERSFGKISLNEQLNQIVEIEVYLQDGSALHLKASSSKQGLKQVTRGSLTTADGNVEPITWSDLNLHSNGILSVNNFSTISVLAGGINFRINAKPENLSCRVYNGKKLDYQTDISICNFTNENINGFGFIKLSNTRNNPDLTDKIIKPFIKPQNLKIAKNDLVISTQSNLAMCSNFVGGKGSSLAHLHQINDKFVVPTSICITSSAFKLHLENWNHLKDLIRELEAIAWKCEKGNLEVACQKLMSAMKQTDLSSNIKQCIQNEMEKAFGVHYQSIRLAVRSSAIGEDSEELSCAGQNDTYLGISGFENICEAVINCWASQFTFIACEYKRQHGQLINPGMAVVIQEMIPAEVAGVLFTHDPSTGNPSSIIITANYGLGETVVSASAEPDTFFVNRTYDNRLNVKEKILGSKTVQTVQITDKNGTENVSVNSEESAKFCLSDEQCLELARMSIAVEQALGSARDIEWCILNEHMYLLQARPITSFDQFSEFEIMHEFDSPIKTDREHCTKANTGEVFPNATTPLTLSTIVKVLDLAIQINMISDHSAKYVMNPYSTYTQVLAYNHCMLNCIDLLCRDCDGKRTDAFRAIEISVYGHSLENDEMYKISGERYRSSAPSTFQFTYRLIKGLILNYSVVKKLIREYGNFQFPLEDGNSDSLYSSIMKLIPEFIETIRSHCKITATSTFWNLIAVMTLTEGSSDWSESVYTDLAALLANCTDVKSSEVPIAMQELAKTIAADDEKDDFYKMDVKIALEWLKNHKGKVGKLFNEFLKNHGHRCMKELDLYSRTWKLDPTGLVQILQNLQLNGVESTSKKQTSSIKETIDKLQTPKKSLTKKLLAWILPRYRANVGYREHSKSIVIGIVDQLRMAYHKLSDQMMKEGFLPDPELIFFFTHAEIGRLIKTRSPKLLKRALQRKKMQAHLEKLKFPEIIVGVPKPIQVEQTNLEEENSVFQISGTPVCNGIAKGVARVILNLDEATNIQRNDILITYCTDIGWSPFFPLLSGIVTEIGGIVSHGAVVAREYGLPCIVGAHNATRLFKSGEHVILNGGKGSLQKTTDLQN